MTAGLFVAAGMGAAGVIFSDRLSDLWRGKEWAEPSTAWMALFHEKAQAPKAPREAKVENAVLITPPARVQEASAPAPRLQEPPARVQEPPPPAVQEQPRRAVADTTATGAASSTPGTTSSLSAAPVAAARELPWLPEAEKRAESLEVNPTPPPARVAVSTPDVAPIALPVPSPAASSPLASEVADLMKRARGHIERGDIAGARLLLERAASGNEPSALMALAETYDPTMLAKWGARGLKADPGKARALYLRASERGIAEARARMLALR